jgi:hypothetical protein
LHMPAALRLRNAHDADARPGMAGLIANTMRSTSLP